MKNFLAIFVGLHSSAKKEAWNAMDENVQNERKKAGMAAWGKWMKDHAEHIVDPGAPLGKTKRVDDNGITDITNEMAVYIIVKAESHEEAAKMFENHPHFAIFPGDGVEIMPCMPMPGL